MEGIKLTKTRTYQDVTYYDCIMENKLTVERFIKETRDTAKYCTWYVQEKQQIKRIYTDGEKVVYVLCVNTNAIVKKAKASEYNGQYWFSIKI